MTREAWAWFVIGFVFLGFMLVVLAEALRRAERYARPDLVGRRPGDDEAAPPVSGG